jgi:hypothetical protein
MNKKKSKISIRSRVIRHLRKWPRQLGIFAAFFLIFLSVSGIALNHTNLLSLSHKSITNHLLLDHYGIKLPNDVRYYQHKKWLVTDQILWLGDKVIYESDDVIISLGKFQSYHLLATTKQLIIFTDKGKLIDKLDSSSDLPVPISALSVIGNNIILNTPNGYFQSDSDFMEWQSIQTFVEPRWVVKSEVTELDITLANIKYQSQLLSWERVVLDAHSGRLFGDFGVWFMDVVALILILLSISGIYIWLRYAKSKR